MPSAVRFIRSSSTRSIFPLSCCSPSSNVYVFFFIWYVTSVDPHTSNLAFGQSCLSALFHQGTNKNNCLNVANNKNFLFHSNNNRTKKTRALPLPFVFKFQKIENLKGRCWSSVYRLAPVRRLLLRMLHSTKCH